MPKKGLKKNRKSILSRGEKLAAIRKFVSEQRKRFGITGFKGHQPEPSCFMFGEFKNLLWFGLMNMPEYDWRELENPEVLDGVYQEVLWETKN